MIKGNLLSKYYLATPIFMLIEFVAGINLRVSLPWGENYLLYLYMGGCFVLGGFILKKPLHLNIFALFESSVNLFLFFKSVYLPIFVMALNPEQAGGINFGITEIIHLVMVVAILLYAFYTNPLIKKK